MRMLPMQITGVVTSLASGMPVYMVAIQQGGQLKDSFGGIGAAAKATAGYVLGLVNPYTVPNRPSLSTPLPAQPYSNQWRIEAEDWSNAVQELRQKLMGTADAQMMQQGWPAKPSR